MPLPGGGGDDGVYITIFLVVIGVLTGLYVAGILDEFLPDSMRWKKIAPPLKVQLISPTQRIQKVDAILKEDGLPSVDDILAEDPDANPRDHAKSVQPIIIVNEALDCAVVPVMGDQCPEGYETFKRACAEGFCCKLKEDAVEDVIEKATGLPTGFVVGVGFELIFSAVLSKMIGVVSNAIREALVKLVSKTTSKTVSKVAGKMLMIMTKAQAGPVGWVIMAADMINLLVDIYDPRGYNQFGSNVAFKATRDKLEQMFVSEMKTVMPGPPFLYPWVSVLTKQIKDPDGKDSTIMAQAVFMEMVTSFDWLVANEPAQFERVVKAAEEAAITFENGNKCAALTDACSTHKDRSACINDPSDSCAFAEGKCMYSNWFEGGIALVPLHVRDRHFFDAVKELDEESSKLIKIFDRKKHRWFKGMHDLPYAITLTEKGRDKVNKERQTADAPVAVMTKHYRDIGNGMWKNVEKNVDAEGMEHVNFGGKKIFTSIENVPKMVDKTIPEPLCMITMGEILRAICEDPKTGGIEDLGPLLAEKMKTPTKGDPDLPRDNLEPARYGVTFDWNLFRCNYTKAYCDRVGLETFTNQFGETDCKLRSGQGWGEMLFGTTLTREVVGTFESFGETLDALFNPKRHGTVLEGGECKLFTECQGHTDRRKDKLMSCCPKDKKEGEAIRNHLLIGAALTLAGPMAPIVFTATGQTRFLRTCQKMQWTSSGGAVSVPWCPYDAFNPKLGSPIDDGMICGRLTTCERCKSDHNEFWYSKGFTACGREPAWVDGKVCGPGTTCKKCANGSSRWDDGMHRCGPRVAGTTQKVGEACSYDRHCIAHTSTEEGSRTKCCLGKCALAEKSGPGVWWCPGNTPSTVKVGDPCNRKQACIAHTATTDQTGCCEAGEWSDKSNKTCQVMYESSPGIWWCPKDPNKPTRAGSLTKGTQCKRKQDCSGHTSKTEQTGCCEAGDWSDKSTKTCQSMEKINGFWYCPKDPDKPVQEGSITKGQPCTNIRQCEGFTSRTEPTGCCEVNYSDKNIKTCQAKVRKGAVWYCPQDPNLNANELGGACDIDQHCIAHTSTIENERTKCCDKKCTKAVWSEAAWWCPKNATSTLSEGQPCGRLEACIGHTSMTEPTGCCEVNWSDKENKTCQKKVRKNAWWYCPKDPAVNKSVVDGNCNNSSNCQGNLVCCNNKCQEGVTAYNTVHKQCPETCRGYLTWPQGTCGMTWNTNISGQCNTCGENDRDKAWCNGCFTERPKDREANTKYCAMYDCGGNGYNKILTNPSRCEKFIDRPKINGNCNGWSNCNDKWKVSTADQSKCYWDEWINQTCSERYECSGGSWMYNGKCYLNTSTAKFLGRYCTAGLTEINGRCHGKGHGRTVRSCGCPSEFEKNNNKCKKVHYQNRTCTSYNQINGICPNGWEINPLNRNKCVHRKDATCTQENWRNCDLTWTRSSDGSHCEKPGTCPSGYSSVGNLCRKNGGCANGWSKKDNHCLKN